MKEQVNKLKYSNIIQSYPYAAKVSDKIQQSFMIKILMLKIEVSYSDFVKSTYKNLEIYIIINSERFDAFPLRWKE